MTSLTVPSAIGVTTVLNFNGNGGDSNAKHAPFSPAGPCPNKLSNLKNSFVKSGERLSFFSLKKVIICVRLYLRSRPGILYENSKTLFLKSSNPSFFANSGFSNNDVNIFNISNAAILVSSSLSSRLTRMLSRVLRRV